MGDSGDDGSVPGPEPQPPRRDLARQVLTWLVIVVVLAAFVLLLVAILNDDPASAPSGMALALAIGWR